MAETRGRSGSLGVPVDKQPKKRPDRKKSGMRQMALRIVKSDHVTVTPFDETSYALVDGLLSLLEKGKKDFKAVCAWTEKALDFHKTAHEQMKENADASIFWGNVFHSIFRVSHQPLSGSLLQRIRSALSAWEELYASNSESFPSILSGFSLFLSTRKCDPHSALIGLRPSLLVLGSLSTKNPEPAPPDRKMQKISSLEQLPVSILQMKADMVESSCIGTNALDLARQALKFTKKGSKPCRGDLVIIWEGSEASNGSSTSPSLDHSIPRFTYARVVSAEKSSLTVTTDPFGAQTIKVTKAELFPDSLNSSFENASSYPSLIDDGYEALSCLIDRVLSKGLEHHLRELPGMAPCLEIFDIVDLSLKVKGKELQQSQLPLLGKLAAQLRAVIDSPALETLSQSVLQVINEWVGKETDTSHIYIPHRDSFQSRVETLRSEAHLISLLRFQEIENSVQRYYLFFTKNAIFSFTHVDSETDRGDTPELTGSLSSSCVSSLSSSLFLPGGPDPFEDSSGDDKAILGSADTLRRRTTLVVGDAGRRGTAASQKWVESTASAAGNLKPKANSIKVQMQRKRVLLGSLIDECSIYCTRLEKLDVLKSLPQELAADKKSRFKSKPFSVMFGVMTNIWKLEQEILKGLQECMAKWPAVSIGAALRPFYSTFFRLYHSFVNTVFSSILSFHNLIKTSKVVNNFFKKFSEATRPEDFGTDLMKLPLGRIPVFASFLQKFSNDTSDDDDDYRDLQIWNQKLVELSKVMNLRESSVESLGTLYEISKKICGFPGKLLKPDRCYLLDGSLAIEYSVPERGTIQEQYHYFLFSDCLVACQPEGKKKDRTFYVIRSIPLISIESINPHDDPKDKSNSFSLDLGDFSSITFTAPSPAEKQQWVENLWKSLEEVAQKKVFRVDLLELMSRQDPSMEGEMEIPKVMFECLHYLYSKGITKSTLGILEADIQSTNEPRIGWWKERFDRAKYVDLFATETNVEVVVGLFKTWLAELPEPLLPWNCYQAAVDAIEEGKKEAERISELKAVLKPVPMENKVVLSQLVNLLADAMHFSQNPQALCEAFASFVIRPEKGEGSGNEWMVIQLLVSNPKDFFVGQTEQPSKHLDVETGTRGDGSRGDNPRNMTLFGSRNRSASAYQIPPS